MHQARKPAYFAHAGISIVALAAARSAQPGRLSGRSPVNREIDAECSETPRGPNAVQQVAEPVAGPP